MQEGVKGTEWLECNPRVSEAWSPVTLQCRRDVFDVSSGGGHSQGLFVDVQAMLVVTQLMVREAHRRQAVEVTGSVLDDFLVASNGLLRLALPHSHTPTAQATETSKSVADKTMDRGRDNTMSRKQLARSRCAAARVGTIAVAVSRWVTCRTRAEAQLQLLKNRAKVTGMGLGRCAVSEQGLGH